MFITVIHTYHTIELLDFMTHDQVLTICHMLKAYLEEEDARSLNPAQVVSEEAAFDQKRDGRAASVGARSLKKPRAPTTKQRR